MKLQGAITEGSGAVNEDGWGFLGSTDDVTAAWVFDGVTGINEKTLGGVYRHINDNFKLGVGYNFGIFSDDLRDLTYDDQGFFVNAIGKF